MDLSKFRNIIIVLAIILLIVEFVGMDYDHFMHWRNLIKPFPMVLLIIALVVFNNRKNKNKES